MVLVRVRVNRSAISTHHFSTLQGRTQDRRRRLFQGECGEREARAYNGSLYCFRGHYLKIPKKQSFDSFLIINNHNSERTRQALGAGRKPGPVHSLQVCGLCPSGVQSRVPGQVGRSPLNLKDFQPLHDQKRGKFAQFLLIVGK